MWHIPISKLAATYVCWNFAPSVLTLSIHSWVKIGQKYSHCRGIIILALLWRPLSLGPLIGMLKMQHRKHRGKVSGLENVAYGSNKKNNSSEYCGRHAHSWLEIALLVQWHILGLARKIVQSHESWETVVDKNVGKNCTHTRTARIISGSLGKGPASKFLWEG